MTSTVSNDSIWRAWRLFLLELEMAKHYHYPYLLYMGRTHRNPLLERLLLSLLYIKGVALLDDALAEVLDARGLHLPSSKYRDDLCEKISILADIGRAPKPR